MDIFLDDADRGEFLARLSRLIREHGSRCFGYVLMSNHFHIALQTGEQPLAQLMRRLSTGYARYFNQQHARVGHVFQNRYGARRIHSDGDLAGVIAYLARNPLDAGIVTSERELLGYRWSSYPALMGACAPDPFLAVDAVLELFGRNPAEARCALRERVDLDGDWNDESREEMGNTALRAAPSSGFAAFALRVCKRRGVRVADVRGGSRHTTAIAARAEIARCAAAAHFTRREIASELGVSESTVSRILRNPSKCEGSYGVARADACTSVPDAMTTSPMHPMHHVPDAPLSRSKLPVPRPRARSSCFRMRPVVALRGRSSTRST
jgi:REP element-mobilizing transposase RayT